MLFMTQPNNDPSWRLDRDQWFRVKQEEAAALFQRSNKVCRALFESGDLMDFLALLSRLHQYDYRNLLLIYDQLPDATCLGAFAAWKNLCPNSAKMVLNEKGIKKGILLLAPYTLLQKGKYHLTWYSVRQYDVSQTNLDYTPPSVSPYVMDAEHISVLMESVRAVLSYSFRKSLLLLPKHHPLLVSELVYTITPEAVLMRGEESILSRLQNMTDAMGRLSANRESIPAVYHTLFAQCVGHCLFTIWGHPDQYPAPLPGSRIISVPSDVQPVFLDALQRTVRQIEETTACAYRLLREKAALDLLDGEDVETFIALHPDVKL